MDDAALIQRILGGCREDFEILVERHQKVLYAFVYRYLHDAQAADEVIQEAFVQAYVHLGGFRGDSSFKTWLHQIALNACRARQRFARARHEVPLADIPEGQLADERSSPPAATAATLERHIARLPPRQRAVLMLRIFSDLSFKEIGRVEGISENSAKVNFHHAITRLKQWLARETS